MQPGGPGQARDASVPRLLRAPARALATAGRLALLPALFLGAGLPATLLLTSLRQFLSSQLGYQPGYSSVGTTFSMSVAEALLALALFLVAFAGIPALWRRLSDPAGLRALAYAGTLLVSTATGLLTPCDSREIGAALSCVLQGSLTMLWWRWEKRWRGDGIAPSLLAGIVRPKIQPGQVWYAFTYGAKQSKIRPVLVIGPDPHEPSRWLVAYSTSSDPTGTPHEGNYVHARIGQIRGLPKPNWVNVADLRTLPRRHFRSYAGLAPTWLYEQVCQRSGASPHPDARTLGQTAGARAMSHAEGHLSRAFGVRRDHGAPEADYTLTRDFVRALLGRRPGR